ncbi:MULTISPECIES: integrase family protein [unclassified Caballeronia]|uniref:tyrosine-type recombinase/integrase n=1 Tax=unclassified Caballeronia TaxID=2646786 RepID=UPI00285AE3EB|nr:MULTISPECIES: integrase family protein [unclassified Caballeronia]MDR5772477.1 integrase family protein [Caballeronia sp. LZ002]MDR5847911.1 integrase family protein [Caballeronia sp. LZ003]
MSKVKFTATRIRAHVCPEGKSQAFLWDCGATGLGLRATRSGARTYIFQGKLHGSTLRITIGSPDAWTIAQAQDEARRLQRLVDAGKDPREEAAERRAASLAKQVEERRRDVTVGEAWEAYIEDRRGRWSQRHYQDHLRLSTAGGIPYRRGRGTTMPGPLAHLMALKLSELTGERIAVWLKSQTSERPTMAALSYRLLRAFIRWTEDVDEYSGVVPAGSYNARRVRDAVPRVRAKEGDVLQREQLKLWFDAVTRLDNPVISAYLQALLLTGARREEMAALRWSDIDFRWRSLSLSDKVEETGRVIPLGAYLSMLLSGLPRRSEWVFSSTSSADGRLNEPSKGHVKALAVAGLPHVSLHGLRRSFGTLCEWVEMPAGVSAQIMGHKPSALAEKHYRRRPLDLLRAWYDKIEAWILAQAGVEFDASHTMSLRAVN